VYEPTIETKTKQYIFPKVDRGLLNLEKNNSPSPTSYNVVDDP
jgi:hypothetical protein